jgi:hypothetical protein
LRLVGVLEALQPLARRLDLSTESNAGEGRRCSAQVIVVRGFGLQAATSFGTIERLASIDMPS